MKKRLYSGALAAVMSAGVLFGVAAPVHARANSKEKTFRIGTYVGSAATAYALAKGKGTWALIGAGATLLSYSQWKKEIKRRHRREGNWSDYQRYRSNWYRSRRR